MVFGMDLATPLAPDNDPRGFPSPARDYFTGGIDLNRHLIRDRTCTFIMRVAGDSMAGAGISDGDEIIVDRSLTPKDGSVVVAVLDGELLIRRLVMRDAGTSLIAEPANQPSPVHGDGPGPAGLTVWGVVTRCLHHV